MTKTNNKLQQVSPHRRSHSRAVAKETVRDKGKTKPQALKIRLSCLKANPYFFYFEPEAL